jgi:predicted enzyme related to lactoylglutathione lyase
MSWISVEDIDDMMRDIPANGGTVLDKPKDSDLGRSAVLQGPTGGVFGIVQLAGAAEPDTSAQAGDFVLSQLWTDSFEVALGFYAVIGDYTTLSVTYGNTKYRIMQGDGVPRALIRLAPPGKANRWIPFVLSGEVDALSKKAKGLGATILVAPRSVPMLGRIAVIQAPTGGIMGFITPLDSPLDETD